MIKEVSFSGNRKEMPSIAIFGAGIFGVELGAFLNAIDMDFFFLDNDVNKQRQTCLDMPVYAPEMIKEMSDILVVICCAKKNLSAMQMQIKDMGHPFVTQEYFLGQYLTRKFFELSGKLFVSSCQIVLTERCSLKCKKCAHACYAVSADAEDLSINEVKESADAFFTHVDYVQEFTLIGGEPLLYGDLDEVIAYIGEKYRDKMFIFSITTNGTILPSAKTIELAKNYRLTFRISNYSEAISHLQEKYDRLCEQLQTEGVSYVLGKADTTWFDYGFESIDRGGSVDELRRVFHSCLTACHEVRKHRLYYCVMARSVADNLGMEIGKNDYLELSMHGSEAEKKRVWNFIKGDIEKGYLDMCNYCRGADAANFPIPAAEQMQRD